MLPKLRVFLTVCQTPLQAFPGSSPFILMLPREPRIVFGPCFAFRETEAQNNEVTWLGLLNQKVVGGLVWRPNSGAAVLEFSVRVSHWGTLLTGGG